MSKRNTQEAKRAARERLREERQKEAKREKLRRQLIIGISAVAVLGIAAMVGVAISNQSKGSDNTDWSVVERQVAGEPKDGDEALPEDAPANATGEDGLTIAVGDPDAPHTLGFYEEPRCSHCAEFEQVMGETVQAGLDAGDYNSEYVFGSFFDDQPQVGGDGSKNAVSALGAALNVSPEAFLGYVEALYSTDFHTSTNGIEDFGDDDRLIEIGKSVEALDDPADFTKFEDAVKNSTFAIWAQQMSDKFAESGVESTPTVMIDGEPIETPGSPEMLQAALAAAAEGASGEDEEPAETDE
jgi:protein-disulfide isomerase